MLKKIKKLFIFLLILAGILALWGNLPAKIRAIESILNPVFHKEIINHYADYYHEDPLLVVALIKVESKFFKRAKSARGAVGLMQMMPSTAHEISRELRVKDFELRDLEDPETNIRFGTYHLYKLRRDFGNHNITVLSAYNAGSKNVRDWLRGNRERTLEIEEIEFYETRKFTRDVLTTYRWLKRIQGLRKKIFKNYIKKT